uniref:Uncharacterized protein n=1 Tax=Arundo donax TaxID=35708 RepID=A0A0A9DYX6_ARUDO
MIHRILLICNRNSNESKDASASIFSRFKHPLLHGMLKFSFPENPPMGPVKTAVVLWPVEISAVPLSGSL